MAQAAWDPERVSFLYSVLTEPLQSALQVANAVATEGGVASYAVGGAIRDFILRRPVLDIDIVIEGPAIPVASEVAARLGAAITTHEAFGTATVHLPGDSLDFVTARSEIYLEPGALPVPRPGCIADDLARRDFSINAMAVRLTPPPHLFLDPFGGLGDARDRLVRVLHDRSFQDDATRMLRAARYAAQLGFAIEERTRQLLVRDLRFLDTISGARLFHELCRTLQSPAAADALALAGKLGILAAIHPALSAGEAVIDAIRRAQMAGGEAAAPETLLCLLAREVESPEAAQSLAERLALSRRFAKPLAHLAVLRGRLSQIERPALRPSTVVSVLDRISPHALWSYALLNPQGIAGRHIQSYLETWRHIRPDLSGDDLIALGMSPGPAIGRALRRLHVARLDGLARSREDEIALIEREIGRSG